MTWGGGEERDGEEGRKGMERRGGKGWGGGEERDGEKRDGRKGVGRREGRMPGEGGILSYPVWVNSLVATQPMGFLNQRPVVGSCWSPCSVKHSRASRGISLRGRFIVILGGGGGGGGHQKEVTDNFLTWST